MLKSLNILQAKLENEDEEHKISFVGVSNRSLGAIKENLGIFVVTLQNSI